jgi:hypothetical protein
MKTGWKMLISSISGDGELLHKWITLPKKIIIITFTIVKCTIYENDEMSRSKVEKKL